MKTRVMLTAAAVFAALAGQCFAFEASTGLHSQGFVTLASCDIHGEDQQATCAADCDDKFVRHSQDYMADHAKLAAEKKACDAKCGCPQNTK